MSTSKHVPNEFAGSDNTTSLPFNNSSFDLDLDPLALLSKYSQLVDPLNSRMTQDVFPNPTFDELPAGLSPDEVNEQPVYLKGGDDDEPGEGQPQEVLPSARLIDEEPDGTITSTQYSADGELASIERLRPNGDIERYQPSPDGGFIGSIEQTDGTIITGWFTSELEPEAVAINYPDGRERSYVNTGGVIYDRMSYPDGNAVEERRDSGTGDLIEIVAWNADGTTKVTTDSSTTTHFPDGMVIVSTENGLTTHYPDGSQTQTLVNADGSSRTLRFAPGGALVGDMALPPNAEIEHLPSGGMQVRIMSGTGQISRSFTVDANGNYLVETSYYPNGSPREEFSYGPGTRTSRYFTPSGELDRNRSRTNEPFTRPNISPVV